MKKLNFKYETQKLTKEEMKRIVAGEVQTCPCGIQSPCYVGGQDSGLFYTDPTINLCRDFDEDAADEGCVDMLGMETESNGCTCAFC